MQSSPSGKKSAKGGASRGDTTPVKLGQLLSEGNRFHAPLPSTRNAAPAEQSITIDMIKAKAVMKDMTSDQQQLVEQLLTKLRQEQQMRL